MIETIIESCIRNRFLVLIAAAGLATWGIYAVLNTPMDAIPDLSENQVIVFTDWPGRSPREIEDQITYPLSLKLQGLAGIKTVRSSSEFNFSMIALIFEDRINYYFARQRVLEKLDEVRGSNVLPSGVAPRMAADATALGQIFWYTVEPSPEHPLDPARLWALNKYTIVPQLNSASGVSEVATVGGAPLEYQIDIKPEALRAYGVTLADVYAAVAKSNFAAGGGVIHKNNAEYLVRFVGWIKNKESIENTVLRRDKSGAALLVKNVATVQLGQQFRRSVFEKDGNEVTGGVVLMRYGENPLAVTERVKDKIQELQAGLPAGVRIVPAYDRTRLIHGAIHTLTRTMMEEMIIAALAVFLILWHVRSAIVICVTLPLSVLFSFLLMELLRRLGIIDIQANIMSLAGITISIGILVDQAIVMTENATHHLKEQFGNRKVTGDTRAIVIRACRTVGRPIFFSVMIMLISFIPVFALSGLVGKLFRPLAFTKSFALIGVAILSVTVVPALIPTFLKGRLKSEEDNWIVRGFINIYKPVLTWALPRRNFVMWSFAVLLVPAAAIFPLQALIGLGASESAHRMAFLLALALVLALTLLLIRGLHWQIISLASLVLLALVSSRLPRIGVIFRETLDEQSVLEMPVTVPRVSITQAADDLKHRDALFRGFPEVESVIGKAGRADTPTDPAPLDMVETFINFRPKELWPKRVLRYADASRQVRATLRLLEERGYVKPADDTHADDRDSLIANAAQKALERFDEILRELASRRYRDFERELGPVPLEHKRMDRWRERVKRINWELHDYGVDAFSWLALEEVAKAADKAGWLIDARHGLDTERFAEDARLASTGKGARAESEHFIPLKDELRQSFAAWVFFWQRQSGPKGDLVDDEFGRVVQVPGWTNIFTQPIVNRIEMLSSGVRTDIGVKVFGPDLAAINRVCKDVEAVLKEVPGARAVVTNQTWGKGYLEIDIDLAKAARYGVNVEDIKNTVEVALGGQAVTQTVEGRERFPVRLRYPRSQREDEETVRRLLVGGRPEASGIASASRDVVSRGANTTPLAADDPNRPHKTIAEHGGRPMQPLQIPLSLVADVRVVEGPAVMKSENAQLVNYVTLMVGGRDTVGFVEEAQRAVADKVPLPEGVHLEWTGEFEHQVRAARTLRFVFPAAILLIFLILYMTYKDFLDACLMMLAVPEALAGGAFFQFLFPKILHGWSAPPMDFSVAVWVGYIACFGMATETGIIMLVYLREAIDKRGGLEKIQSLEELRQAVIEGAVHRLRPKLLTEGVAIIAIAPMLWAAGVGAEVIAPMAVPVLGGLLISDEVVDIFLPVRFYWLRRARWLKLHQSKPTSEASNGVEALTQDASSHRVGEVGVLPSVR